MVDPYHVKGPDGVIRRLNEHYDSQKDVERDPYGAWLAIQNLREERERLRAFAESLIGQRQWVFHGDWGGWRNVETDASHQARKLLEGGE